MIDINEIIVPPNVTMIEITVRGPNGVGRVGPKRFAVEPGFRIHYHIEGCGGSVGSATNPRDKALKQNGPRRP